MARVLPLLMLMLVPGGIGYAIGRFRNPKDYRIVALREHARLLEAAGKASRRGQSGLAEIYEHGATEALELADRPPR